MDIKSLITTVFDNSNFSKYSINTSRDLKGNDQGIVFSAILPEVLNVYFNGNVTDDTINVYVVNGTDYTAIDSFEYKYTDEADFESQLTDAINAYKLVADSVKMNSSDSKSVLLTESSNIDVFEDDSDSFGDENTAEDTEDDEYSVEELAGKLSKVKAVVDQVGDKLQELCDLVREDTDQKINLTSFSADAYDLASSLQDLIDELVPPVEDEILEESIHLGKRSKKSTADTASLAMKYLNASLNIMKRSPSTPSTKSIIKLTEDLRVKMTRLQ